MARLCCLTQLGMLLMGRPGCENTVEDVERIVDKRGRSRCGRGFRGLSVRNGRRGLLTGCKGAMSSPSNRKQKVKVRYEQQLPENRIRRTCLRGILRNDIRCAERRTPRRQRTPGKGTPADAGSPRRQRTHGKSAPGRQRTRGKSAPTDAGSPGRATCSQTKRGEACRSCPPCRSSCRREAWTLPSGATPPCASAPCRPSPHPETCALLGEAGRSAVACRRAPCVGMGRAGVGDRRERRLLLWGRLLL